MNTLEELYDALDPLHDELTRYEEDQDAAETEHEIAEARAALTTQGQNAEKRKAEIVLSIEKEAWAVRVAKRHVSAARRRMKILELKIDITRTKEANARRSFPG